MKTKWTELLLGFLLGGILSMAATLHFVNQRLERDTRERLEEAQKMAELSSEWQKTVGAFKQRAETCEARLQVLEMPEAETPAYTMLYELDAQASPASPFELLNLFRPGLGTALAAMKSQTELQQLQMPGQHPRWLVPGYVKPIFNGDAQHARYVWLNAQTGKRDVFAPRGTVVQ
jgi:hypothetical protein